MFLSRPPPLPPKNVPAVTWGQAVNRVGLAEEDRSMRREEGRLGEQRQHRGNGGHRPLPARREGHRLQEVITRRRHRCAGDDASLLPLLSCLRTICEKLSLGAAHVACRAEVPTLPTLACCADGPWICAFHEFAALDNAFILGCVPCCACCFRENPTACLCARRRCACC